MAVDNSQLNAGITHIRAEIDHLFTAMRDAHNALGRIHEALGRIEEQVEGLSIHVDRLTAAADTATATATARDGRMQLGLDAIRLDHLSFADMTWRQVAEATQRSDALLAQGMRTFELSELLMVRTGNLDYRTEALVSRSDTLVSRTDTLVSRADMLAHRATVSLGSEILMRTLEGLLLVPAEDIALVSAVWESHGQLEPGTLKVITALLRDGDTVIDVGANIGLVTLPAARAVGPTGHVIAVEPAARVADLLDRSLFLNLGPGRATLHRCAAGEEAGTALLNIGATSGHSSLLPLQGSSQTEEVKVARLDDLIEPGRRIRLVKIDAEGFEPSVWRGMRRVLADNPELVVVVEFGPEHLRRADITLDEWLDPFLSPGFSAYEIDEASGSLKPVRPRVDLHRVVSLNLLLLRLPPPAYPMLEFA